MKNKEFVTKLVKFGFITSITALLITVGYLGYLVNELQKYKPIATLNFSEDEWLKVNHADVYSFSSPVTPNDKLFIELNVTNKKPIRFDIEPSINVDVGGQALKTKNDFGVTQLGINYTGLLPSYTFFASEEGQNNLKVSLHLAFRNGTSIKYENATTDFHVLSVGDKILTEQNQMIFGGIFVSAIGVITTSIISIIQTNRNKEEKDLTQRPWVGVSQNLRLENPLQLVLPYTNYGKIPTNSIKADYLISGTKITRIDLYESSLIRVLDLGTVMPTMKQDLMIGLTKEQSDHVSYGNEFYVGILINYTYSQKKNGEYGVIYYYDHLGKLFMVSEEWTDKSPKIPYIQNASNEITDRHVGTLKPSDTKSSIEPLKRILTEDITLLDVNNNRVLIPQINQPTRVGLTIKNNQNKVQDFVYLIQVQNERGGTEHLLSSAASLRPWQILQPSVVWVPKVAGEHFIQIFVWEKLDEPHSLAPPLSFQITVSSNIEHSR